jgi:hypothetical protein
MQINNKISQTRKKNLVSDISYAILNFSAILHLHDVEQVDLSTLCSYELKTRWITVKNWLRWSTKFKKRRSGGLRKKGETFAIFDCPAIFNFFKKLFLQYFLNRSIYKNSKFQTFLSIFDWFTAIYGLASILKFAAILKKKLPKNKQKIF